MRSRVRAEVPTPKTEPARQPSYSHSASTRVYATGSSTADIETELQFESSAGIVNDELELLDTDPTYVPQSTSTMNNHHYLSSQDTNLSPALKQNLRNLKNVLKLPKART